MTSELLLIIGKGALWWGGLLAFCAYQIWTVRRRDD